MLRGSLLEGLHAKPALQPLGYISPPHITISYKQHQFQEFLIGLLCKQHYITSALLLLSSLLKSPTSSITIPKNLSIWQAVGSNIQQGWSERVPVSPLNGGLSLHRDLYTSMTSHLQLGPSLLESSVQRFVSGRHSLC